MVKMLGTIARILFLLHTENISIMLMIGGQESVAEFYMSEYEKIMNGKEEKSEKPQQDTKE